MANLLLTSDNDLDFSSGGLQMVTGIDEIVQKLSTRLRFFLGEWFLDRRKGIPYFEDVFVKNPDLVVVQGIFREVILETPGVASLVSGIDTDLDSAIRKLTVAFSAKSVTGEIIDFNEEFLIGD